MAPTEEYLSGQWSNPSDIFSFLLIIGGDIVNNALAQFAGITAIPVCFSFGWVAYAFRLVTQMTAEGRLMPDCDYPCKVINLKNGYPRDCRSWLLGRFLIDDAIRVQQNIAAQSTKSTESCRVGLTVNVYNWQNAQDIPRKIDWRRLWTVIVILLQLGMAAVPWAVWNDWGPFLITGIGTSLSFLTVHLPQWDAERFSARQNSSSWVAITKGNGSTHIAIVQSLGIGPNFEDLASGRGPMTESTWRRSRFFSLPNKSNPEDQATRTAWLFQGVPIGLWFTRVAGFMLFFAWVALLITATGLPEHRWFLVLVGALGMIQNAVISASGCLPQHRGLDVAMQQGFRGAKVMDVLMDLELVHPGAGRALLDEFFPGSRSLSEIDWWKGNRTPYDSERILENRRGLPGSTQQPPS